MNKMKRTGLWFCALLLFFFLAACDNDGGTMPPIPGSGSSSETVINSSSSGGSIPGHSFIGVGANPTMIDSWYLEWKARWYVTYEDDLDKGLILDPVYNIFTYNGLSPARIKWDGTSNGCSMIKGECTVSEGIGYGMLISLFQGDIEVFHRLYQFAMGMMTYSTSGTNRLLYWISDSFNGSKDGSAATDADLDIAAALILASMKYRADAPAVADEYLGWAKEVANSLWNQLVEGNCNANYLVCSGNSAMWFPPAKDSQRDGIFNLSYFSPVAYRLFAMVDPAHNWQAVIDANYDYMIKVQATGAGLLPDWSNQAGEAAPAPNGTSAQSYNAYDKEALRIGWRIAWDYYWFGDAKAKQVLDGMANFVVGFTGGDVSKIPEKTFLIDGTVSPTRTVIVNAHLGSYCLMGSASYSDWYAACQAAFNGKGWNSSYGYYTQILQLMFGQLMNGKYQKPF
ncbi:MAG: hypothetical protein LBR60_07825 [Fibrobacter sp.]|jgi:endo-1,4-beta-D-glucanase Y|nr:hypothetical protein [Fibrobacter sp.]